jgi:hypothetical protein
LLGTLPVDIEQHILPSVNGRFDRLSRRTVVVIEHARPFEQLATLAHAFEFRAADEMIIYAVAFAWTRRPRRHGNRHRDIGVSGEKPAR